MLEFRDNDAGYLRWLDRHPQGYVVNAHRRPIAIYLVLHRATCPTITRLATNAKTWTHGTFIKVCSDNVSDLHSWARRVPGELSQCGICRP